MQFTLPDIWSLEPFFRLSVVATVRRKQLELWCQLICSYCTFYQLTKISLDSFPYFKNNSIGAELGSVDIEFIANSLVLTGSAEWYDAKKSVLVMINSEQTQNEYSESYFSTSTQPTQQNAINVNTVDNEPLSSSAAGTPLSRLNLRQMSNQNHLAANHIQKLFRAHLVRLQLWQFGGVLMVSRVLKIQRMFRGFQGRQLAATAYRQKVLRAAHKIQGLYYTWHSKRLKLIAHLNFLNKSITKFQSQFRRRKASQLVKIIRFIRHTKMATKMQSVIRMYLAARLCARIKNRLLSVKRHLLEYARQVTAESSKRAHRNVHVELVSILSANQQGNNKLNLNNNYSDINSSLHSCANSEVSLATTIEKKEKWDNSQTLCALDQFLCNLVAVGRCETALDIANNMSLNCQPSIASHTADVNNEFTAHSNLSSIRNSATNSAQSSCANVAPSFLRQDTDLSVISATSSYLPAKEERQTGSAQSKTLQNQAQLSAFAVCMSLLSLWTRSGKIKALRIDFLEEALGIILQSHLCRQHGSANENDQNSSVQHSDNNSASNSFQNLGNFFANFGAEFGMGELGDGRKGDAASEVGEFGEVVEVSDHGSWRNGQSNGVTDNALNASTGESAIMKLQPRTLFSATNSVHSSRSRLNDNVIHSNAALLSLPWLIPQSRVQFLINDPQYNILPETASVLQSSGSNIGPFDNNIIGGANTLSSKRNSNSRPSSPPLSSLRRDKPVRKQSTFQQLNALLRRTSIYCKENLDKAQQKNRVSSKSPQQPSNVSALFPEERDSLLETYFQCGLVPAAQHRGTVVSLYESTLLMSDCVLYHANFKQLLFAQHKDSLTDDNPSGKLNSLSHTARHKLIQKDILQQHSVRHTMVNRSKALNMQVSGEDSIIRQISQLYATIQHNNEPMPVVPIEDMREAYLHEAELRARYRLTRLLHRAQGLLSAHSADCEEIRLRLEVYENLFCGREDCYELHSRINAYVPFRNRSVVTVALDKAANDSDVQDATSQSTRDKKNGKGRQRSVSKSSRSPVRDKAPNRAAPPLLVNQLLLTRMSILQCNRMVLVTGDSTVSQLVATHSADVLTAAVTTLDSSSDNNLVASSANSLFSLDTSDSLLSMASSFSSASHSAAAGSADKQTVIAPDSSPPIVVRPLVLFQSEIEYIARIYNLYEEVAPSSLQSVSADSFDSIGSTTEELYAHRRAIDYNKVGEYLMAHLHVVSCTNKFTEPAVAEYLHSQYNQCGDQIYNNYWPLQNSGFRFSLPVLEYMRHARNETRLVEYSTRILQKVYRGFRGRARYKRLLKKKQEIERQKQNALRMKTNILAMRAVRGLSAAVIQRVARGWRWRKLLRLMHESALLVQCRYRIARAMNRANAERLRKINGPQVVPMIKNGGISCTLPCGEGESVYFTLQIFRCGNNYRLQGVDLLNGVVYEGVVYQPEVKDLIRAFNKDFKGETLADKQSRISLWQHQRISDLIVANLGFARMISSVTTRLGAAKTDTRLILVANKFSTTNVWNVDHTKRSAVGHHFRSYSKLLANHPQLMSNSSSLGSLKQRNKNKNKLVIK